MENYICINGKKAELTEEQMKVLGIELPKANPFARTNPWGTFYYINTIGLVAETFDDGSCDGEACDSKRFAIANYCTDKAIMEQRALHETLNRLLWRYSIENKVAHDGTHYHVLCIHQGDWVVHRYSYDAKSFGEIAFDTREIAEAAIKEIVKPFIKAHPDFKW